MQKLFNDMKKELLLMMVSGLCGIAQAQMPLPTPTVQVQQVPAQQNAQAQPQQQPQQQRGAQPPGAAEPTNPQIMGVEIPLLDPATDTVSYNGGKFDVGNNAAVRAKFETFLHGTPDTSEQAALYSKKIDAILADTKKYSRNRKAIGSAAMVRMGKTLYKLADLPRDGGQSGVLASSIVSALDAQRGNRARDEESAALDRDIDDLVKKTNNYVNRNTVGNKGAQAQIGDIKGPAQNSTSVSNTFVIAHNTKSIAEKQAAKVKNSATNVEKEIAAKITYQSNLVTFLMMRRFDHAVIAARIYRHIFKDGDTKMQIDEKSQANEMLSGVAGVPPTVNTVDSMASEARSSVDKHMEAVHSMLAQNKLGEATQHLIEAVAIGEHMKSVFTFPVEGRRRVAAYWTLRKRALTALNARDYGTVDEIARKMKEMDVDFDDSMLLSYSAGRKRQSDLCIRNARKALLEGKDEEFNKHITEAGTIWPLNPNLDASAKHLEQFDNKEKELSEFRTLFARGEFRTIFKEQERFECVAVDPTLKTQYKEVILLVSTIDAMLKQLESVADQDKVMGPCIAYEKLVEYRTSEPRAANDPAYKDSLNHYAGKAHDFVQALRDAEDCESRREYGSALSNYYRAQCLYPKSTLAGQGAAKVSEIIVKAQY